MKKLFYYSITVLALAFLCEGAIRLISLDIRLASVLFYRVGGSFGYTGGQEILEGIDDPQIIYRAKKNLSVECWGCIHPEEKEVDRVRITTGEYGGRKVVDTPRKASKKIYWVGGSYSFGISTSDDFTIQSIVQKYFNTNKTSAKIIDFSANAYILQNKIAVLRKVIQRLGPPDIVVIQNSNTGRRPFMFDENDFGKYFSKDETLYFENFPNIYDLKAHDLLVTKFALYRTLIMVRYHISYIPYFYQCKEESDNEHVLHTCLSKFPTLFNGPASFDDYANKLSLKRLSEFVESYTHKFKIIVFDPLSLDCNDFQSPYELKQKKGYKELVICNQRPPNSVYHHIHPTQDVYRWYGGVFSKALSEMLKGD